MEARVLNQRTKLFLSLLAVIAVAVMIFFFSAQQGNDSSKLSGSITDWVLRRIVPGYASMTPAEQRPILRQWGFYVRKLAHFSEFALLGITLVRFFNYAIERRVWWPILLAAWVAATIYAGTDELHQMFVDGRGPALTDVCIDSAGALTGALITLLILRVNRHIKGEARE